MKYQTLKQLMIDNGCQYHSEKVGLTSVNKIPFVRISKVEDPRNVDASIIVCASRNATNQGLVKFGQTTKELYGANTVIIEKNGELRHKFCAEPVKFVKADLD